MGAGNPTISRETETQVPAACQPQPRQPHIIKYIFQLQKPTRRITDTWIIYTGKRETRYQLVKVHQTIRQPYNPTLFWGDWFAFLSIWGPPPAFRSCSVGAALHVDNLLIYLCVCGGGLVFLTYSSAILKVWRFNHWMPKDIPASHHFRSAIPNSGCTLKSPREHLNFLKILSS